MNKTKYLGTALVAASLGAAAWAVGQPAPSTAPMAAQTAAACADATNIPDVVERVLPSVVSISTTRSVKPPPLAQDPFFRRFMPPVPPGGLKQQGLGSGVIVAPGIVVTNHHVIDGAQEIRVTTHDDRELRAKLRGSDPESDLAVLELSGDTGALEPLKMADSSRLRLGETVLAIGNPFGVGQTVTKGIVSAKGRADLGITDYEDFIQTDAPINPGNSGGALVDSAGELVGINTAILSRTGGNMGIGFAIPTNMAKPIIESLRKHGKVVRGHLGVTIQNVDEALAKALGLPNADGVLISGVSQDSPAAKAGLKRGDVVLSANGTPTNSTGRLRNIVAAAGAGGKLELEILRDGKRTRVSVAATQAPAKKLSSNARRAR